MNICVECYLVFFLSFIINRLVVFTSAVGQFLATVVSWKCSLLIYELILYNLATISAPKQKQPQTFWSKLSQQKFNNEWPCTWQSTHIYYNFILIIHQNELNELLFFQCLCSFTISASTCQFDWNGIEFSVSCHALTKLPTINNNN